MDVVDDRRGGGEKRWVLRREYVFVLLGMFKLGGREREGGW